MRKSTFSSDPFKGFRYVRPRKERTYEPPVTPPFTHAEVEVWLEHIKKDFWWKNQMPISVTALALALNTTENNLKKCLKYRGKVELERALTQIARIIPDIEARRIAFPARSNSQRGVPNFFHLEPQPCNISRLSDNWSLWARCLSCGGNKFLPVEIDGKPHVACYHCLPPSQYRSFGGKPVQKSLIHEALKKYY
jgi:hypothetical protein